ncbi:hypothetical protein [Afifella sp. H1R]|uniref:hypothetical protein n=1 Tax=unclassified Afifella TaxID=2624128 RepID=UPI001F2095E0|nr:hypothetical protein [Afifella sp. H1R]MCF1502610.1 hypothetical protein [Afifella sp. H1R]
MDATTIVLIELIFFFGGVLVFGLWQIVSVRRADRQAKLEEESKQALDRRPPR